MLNNKTLNRAIRKDMVQAVKWNEFFVYFISGMPGAGKSWFSLELAKEYAMLYQDIIKQDLYSNWYFNSEDYETPSMQFKKGKHPKESVDIYFTYSNFDSTESFKIAKERSLIIQDESPQLHGKGSRIIKDQLSNIVKIAARRNTLNLIILNPAIFEIKNEINYYFRVLGKNRETRKTIALLFNSSIDPIGIIEKIVNLPKTLIEKYEKVSKEKKTSVQEMAGQSGVVLSEEELRRLADKLIAGTITKGISRKKEFEEYSALVPEIATHIHKDLICREAERIVSQAPSRFRQQSQVTTDGSDQVTVEKGKMTPEGYARYSQSVVSALPKSNSYIDLLDRKIFVMWLDGMSFSEIGPEVNLQVASISKRMRKFREGYVECSDNKTEAKVGKLFEVYCALSKGGSKDDVAGYEDVPDLVLKDTIYTIKFKYDKQKTYYTFDRDFAPEVKEAKIRGKKSIVLLYYNLAAKPLRILQVKLDIEQYDSMAINVKNEVNLFIR